MKLQELLNKINFKIVTNTQKECDITSVFCCDLLSVAMGKAPADGVWVTVMGNVNSIAVATLADIAFIVLAEGAELDETALEKAKSQDVCVLKTDLPIFQAAKLIDSFL